MKVCVALLVLLPLAFAAPQKKFVLDSVLSLLDTSALVQDLQTMVDVIGSDPTEQACELEWHKLAQKTLIDIACPLICHSFQELVHKFRIVPDNSVTPKTF